MLTKEQIKAKKDRKREWVPTPDWAPDDATLEQVAECGVWIGTMRGKARDLFEMESVSRREASADGEFEMEGFKAFLITCCAENEDGSLMFDADDAEWLNDKACGPLNDMFAVALRLNKLGKDDVEELRKN